MLWTPFSTPHANLSYRFIWLRNRISFIYVENSFSLSPLSGQITQWNLIFYGTNDPPQKADPPRLGNNKKPVNDLVHNSLENSQWGFITQDVSIFLSHPIEQEVNGAHNQETISFVFLLFLLSLPRRQNRWQTQTLTWMFSELLMEIARRVPHV